MPKKKKKPATQVNSFTNMVDQAANKKAVQMLEQHVQNVVDQKVAFATAELSKKLLSNLVEMLYRLRNLEDKQGLTKEDVENAVLEYQDEAWGLQQVDRATQKGDFLRITYSFSFDGKVRQQNETGVIDELMKDKFSPNDLPKEIHEALLGKKVGETVEVTDELESAKDKEGNTKKIPIKYEITLNRVSEKLEKTDGEENTDTQEATATSEAEEGNQESGSSS